jgi:hypothetical protein
VSRRLYVVAFLGLCATAWSVRAADDPLPSWNDGAAKQAIVEFVEAVTTEGGADFVAPEDRIATFDQDGTPAPYQFPGRAACQDRVTDPRCRTVI